jgi:hypothetical protein
MFEELSNIKNVEVSPYLYSKILSRIDKNKREQVSGKKLMFVFASLGLILFLNVLAVGFQLKKEKTETNYHSLYPDNSLYNEKK